MITLLDYGAGNVRSGHCHFNDDIRYNPLLMKANCYDKNLY